jgi:hypothetical protein
MADELDEAAAGGEAEAPAQGAGGGRGGGKRARARQAAAGGERDYEEMAARYLSRASRLMNSDSSEQNAKAETLVRAANVLATLELAKAVREAAANRS